MFSVVSKSVVNGKATSPYTLNAFKTMPYIKHITRVPGGIGSVTFSLLMNKKKWDSIPKKDQDLIMSVSGETIASNAGMVDWVQTLDFSPMIVMLIILAFYVALGTVIEGLAMIFLTVPIFVPLVEGLGFDLIWFGIVMVMVLEISLITPPIGLNVFVIKSVLPGVPLKTIFKGIAPFFYRRPDPPCLVVFIPALALWLPSLVYGRY
jgi:hypothetical protein